MNLRTVLTPETVELHLKGTTKEQIIDEMLEIPCDHEWIRTAYRGGTALRGNSFGTDSCCAIRFDFSTLP